MSITFDKSKARFRDAKGRFISASRVHHEINKTSYKLEQNLRSIARQFNQGKINLPAFQIQMVEQIKIGHILTSTIGGGGRNQMTVSDWGKVGVQIREQYKFLNNFAREIEKGKLSANKIEFRAASYSKAVRESFYKQEIKIRKDAGFLFCRRILHATESCPECVFWATKGFVPIEEQPPIGGLVCKNFCRCDLEYLEPTEDLFASKDFAEIEAEAKKLGFSEVQLNITNQDKKVVAEFVMKAFQRLRDQFPSLPIPQKLVFSNNPPEAGWRAWFTSKDKSININLNHYFWGDPGYWMAEEGFKKFYSTLHQDHIIRHEFAHFFHDLLSPSAMKKNKLPTLEKRLIIEKVSIYAASDSSEFVAEVFAGLMDGKVFEDSVMVLYNKYGGLMLK